MTVTTTEFLGLPEADVRSLLEATNVESDLTLAFDSALHPRDPGGRDGGRFIKKGTVGILDKVEELVKAFPVGSKVKADGHGDTVYDVTGYWRGYVTVHDPVKDTSFKAIPKTLTRHEPERPAGSVPPRLVPGFLKTIQRWTDSAEPTNDFGAKFEGTDRAPSETMEFGTALIDFERYPNRAALAKAHDLDGITEGPYGIEGPFLHDVPDGPVIYINWLHNGTPTGSNPHEDNTVVGGNPRDFIKLVNWLREQNVPTYAAFINGPLRDVFMRRFRSDLDLSLDEADLVDLMLEWKPELHPRWPDGTPFGKGGEFMQTGDLLKILEKLPSHSMDVSFIAQGAEHIRSVEARSESGGSSISIIAHLSHPQTGSFPVGFVFSPGERLGIQVALGKLDKGVETAEITRANAGILGTHKDSKPLTYRRFRTLIGAQPKGRMSRLFLVHDFDEEQIPQENPEIGRLLGLIDEVHQHDHAPATYTIPLLGHYELDDWGRMSWRPAYGPPNMIEVQTGGHVPAFTNTVTHEVGHYVDRQVLGQNFFQSSPRTFTLDEDGYPVEAPEDISPPTMPQMEHLFRAIEASNARALQDHLSLGEEIYVDVTLTDGTTIQGRGYPDVQHANYLRRRDESFARAYAQWIALRSGDEASLATIRDDQEGGVGQHSTGAFYGRQWEWDDFKVIADLMDDLFDSYGLLHDSARGADPAGVYASPPPPPPPPPSRSDLYKVGDRVILDGNIPAVVTATSVYVGGSGTSGRRETGVSVRPEGGRARPVRLDRLTRETP